MSFTFTEMLSLQSLFYTTERETINDLWKFLASKPQFEENKQYKMDNNVVRE